MKRAGERSMIPVVARLLLFLSLLVSGCGVQRVSPVLAWVIYPAGILTPRLVTATRGAGGSLDLVWAFDPPGPAVPFTEVTAIFLSQGNPNWRTLVVRDQEALINHLVQPEADYLSTGGRREVVRQAAALRELHALGQALVANYVTFIYPTEIPGFSRPAGTLTIAHSLSPISSSRLEAKYVVGLAPPRGTLEFTGERGVTVSQSNGSDGTTLLISYRSPVYYWLFGAAGAAVIAFTIALAKRRNRSCTTLSRS